jgi:lipoprotein-anchoring transpeptidase ErfK/SrfK
MHKKRTIKQDTIPIDTLRQMNSLQKNIWYIGVFLICSTGIAGVGIAIATAYSAQTRIDTAAKRLDVISQDTFSAAVPAVKQIRQESEKAWYNPVQLATIADDASTSADTLETKYNDDKSYTRKILQTEHEQMLAALKKNELIAVSGLSDYTQSLTKTQKTATQTTATLRELTGAYTTAVSNHNQYERAVETKKKQDIVTALTDTIPESDALTTFFTERAGDPTVLVTLDTYRAKVTAISEPGHIAATTFAILEQEAQTTVLPLLATARTTASNLKTEESNRRLGWVADQQKIWQESGTTSPKAPLGKDVPKQVYVSLKDQHAYLYDQGELINSGPITSGRDTFETISGTFAIYTKKQKETLKSPFEDVKYELKVDYWLPFYSGYGFHDAYWRTVYGGEDYKTAGSHGCINTPYDLVAFLYNWADVGTKVVIQ